MSKYTTIENGNTLKIVFPYTTEFNDCEITINFHRTLRIPDNNKKYHLPPSLGKFPLQHIDDFKNKLPKNWQEHGGIFLPMYQSEAMWISFTSDWPFAVKIASGKINAISGKPWTNKLQSNLKDTEQDYIVVPSQRWIDGFNVTKGVIRQFVAVPLHSGFTVEEQITGQSENGGLQIMVFPMKEEEFRKIDEDPGEVPCGIQSFASTSSALRSVSTQSISNNSEMGFGAGGFMRQKIYKDNYGIEQWSDDSQRVFVHLLNSLQYQNVTSIEPPTKPLTPQEYKNYGYPWFDYYTDEVAINGSKKLSKVASISQLEVIKNKKILNDNTSLNLKKQTIIKIDNKKRKKGDC